MKRLGDGSACALLEIALLLAAPQRVGAQAPASDGNLELLDVLRNGDGDDRRSAALVLARLGDLRAISALAELLHDENPEVRQLALNLLRGYKSDEIDELADALLAKLDDRENLRSIQGLAATKLPRAYAALLDHLDDDEAAYRAIAATELGASGNPDYINPLAARLSDAAPNVRVAVINALLALNAASALPQLEPLLNDEDPQVALYAARTVKRLTRPATP